MASTDGTMGVVPAMLAERLGVPQVTFAVGARRSRTARSRIRRDGDAATETVQASLPAVVSVTDQSGEARYPSFKGIMAAKKKPVETGRWPTSASTPSEVGLGGARGPGGLAAPSARPRTGGHDRHGRGRGRQQLAEFLAAQKFI